MLEMLVLLRIRLGGEEEEEEAATAAVISSGRNAWVTLMYDHTLRSKRALPSGMEMSDTGTL
jgi:hypothetical protein